MSRGFATDHTFCDGYNWGNFDSSIDRNLMVVELMEYNADICLPSLKRWAENNGFDSMSRKVEPADESGQWVVITFRRKT
jgi:hypothetical protein